MEFGVFEVAGVRTLTWAINVDSKRDNVLEIGVTHA